jgi:hypothetical protein
MWVPKKTQDCKPQYPELSDPKPGITDVRLSLTHLGVHLVRVGPLRQPDAGVDILPEAGLVALLLLVVGGDVQQRRVAAAALHVDVHLVLLEPREPDLGLEKRVCVTEKNRGGRIWNCVLKTSVFRQDWVWKVERFGFGGEVPFAVCAVGESDLGEEEILHILRNASQSLRFRLRSMIRDRTDLG